jgi:hypothetical protein
MARHAITSRAAKYRKSPSSGMFREQRSVPELFTFLERGFSRSADWITFRIAQREILCESPIQHEPQPNS